MIRGAHPALTGARPAAAPARACVWPPNQVEIRCLTIPGWRRRSPSATARAWLGGDEPERRYRQRRKRAAASRMSASGPQ